MYRCMGLVVVTFLSPVLMFSESTIAVFCRDFHQKHSRNCELNLKYEHAHLSTIAAGSNLAAAFLYAMAVLSFRWPRMWFQA